MLQLRHCLKHVRHVIHNPTMCRDQFRRFFFFYRRLGVNNKRMPANAPLILSRLSQGADYAPNQILCVLRHGFQYGESNWKDAVLIFWNNIACTNAVV